MRWLKILVTHTYTHIGDVSYIKGMLGQPDITYTQAGQPVYAPVVQRPQRD